MFLLTGKALINLLAVVLAELMYSNLNVVKKLPKRRLEEF
jgi:hypothetical protein